MTAGILQLKNKNCIQKHLTGMYFNLTSTKLGIHSCCFFDVAVGKWKNVHSLCIYLWERQPWIPCENSLFLQWLILFHFLCLDFLSISCSEHSYKLEGLSPTHGQLYVCTCNASSRCWVWVLWRERRCKPSACELTGSGRPGQSQEVSNTRHTDLS